MKINEMSVGATVSGSFAPAPSKIGKVHKRTEEAVNPAQQAAIAVSMKKAGKKPKNLKEGAVKQLIMDLRELKDKEFMKKYGKSKEEMKQGLKSQVDENMFDKITSFIGRPFDEKEIAKDLQNRGVQMNKSKPAAGVVEGTVIEAKIHSKLVGILQQHGFKGPYAVSETPWADQFGDIIFPEDQIMIQGTDVEYDAWVLNPSGEYGYYFGQESGYQNGNAQQVVSWLKTVINQDVVEEKTRLDPKCWTGYKKQGTKMKGGVRVNNCVPKESVEESAILQGMIEARVTEDELLLMPGQGLRFKPELMPKKSDHEVEMARQQLIEIAQNAEVIYELIQNVSEMQGLDAWIQKKIVIANDYMESVSSYLKGRVAVDEQADYMYTTRNYVNRDGEETFSRRTASLRPTAQGTQVRAMDTSREFGDENTINSTIPKHVKVDIVPQHTGQQGVQEEEDSVREKLHRRHQELRKKSGLPDPEYYRELKSTYDMPDDERWARTRELKKKYKVKEQESNQQDQQPQQQEPKQGMDVKKGLGLLSTIGRALNTVTSPTFGDDVKADVRTMIHNKVTGTPNK